jgi:hypothetical protein
MNGRLCLSRLKPGLFFEIDINIAGGANGP